MIKEIWERYATNNFRFSIEDPDYRRAYLLNIILAIGIVVFASFVILKKVATHSRDFSHELVATYVR